MSFSFKQRYFGKEGGGEYAIGEAPLTLPSPNMTHQTDYSVFKCTGEQKSDKIAAKFRHKTFMEKNGLNWKQELNIPENRIESVKL